MTVDSSLFQKMRHIEITAKRYVQDVFSGMYAASFKGRGIELEDVREFEPGDDVRSIHWSKTAQMGRPYVKNYRQERDLTVMLLGDMSGSMNYSSFYVSKQQRLAEVAALIAFSAVYNYDRVGLLLFSDTVEKIIPPKRGLRHGMRLIRDMLSFTPTGRQTDIAGALEYFNRAYKRRCICFLLSDFLGGGDFALPLGYTAKRDDCVLIRIVDPMEQTLLPGSFVMQDLENGTQKLVVLDSDALSTYQNNWELHEAHFQTVVRQSGADAIEIQTKAQFVQQLIAYFNKRKRRMRQ